MESERREHDTFTMSRLSNVNFSSLLTTSKFARLKDFLLHKQWVTILSTSEIEFMPQSIDVSMVPTLHSGLVSEVASKFFQPLKKKQT